MLRAYKTGGITPSRILKLFYVIGELKGADHPTLTSVKNSPYRTVHSKKHFDRFMTDKLLKMTDNQIYQLSDKALNELNNSKKHPKTQKFNVKHFSPRPDDSWGEHRQAICNTLLPIMFSENYYATFYAGLSDHHLEPDACLVSKYPNGYQLKFLEVETEDHGPQYLLKKLDNYKSAGKDVNTWRGWWKHHCSKLGLDYCSKEEFKFSVIFKGTENFTQEGWEWI